MEQGLKSFSCCFVTRRLSGRLGLRGKIFAGILYSRWTGLKTLLRSFWISYPKKSTGEVGDGQFLASSLAYEWPLIPASRLQCKGYLSYSRTTFRTNQRCVLPTANNSFLGDIWQAIRALGIPPVPLSDRVVWTLDTEEDFLFFSACREKE